jgi:hypothetical protein
MYKMGWNSRSKLNFVHCFKPIHTHTQLECTLKKRKKKFKLYPEGYLVEWWMMHLFSWESSPFGTEFFVIHPLTSAVTISWENLKPPLTVRGVLHTFA